MTTEHREDGDAVRITQREVYDQVLEVSRALHDTSGKIDRALDEIARQGKDVKDHEARIAHLELGVAVAATLATTVATHGGQLVELRSRVDRSSWAPALIAGIIPTVLGALAVYALIPQ